jgi:hypothetical protein
MMMGFDPMQSQKPNGMMGSDMLKRLAQMLRDAGFGGGSPMTKLMGNNPIGSAGGGMRGAGTGGSGPSPAPVIPPG